MMHVADRTRLALVGTAAVGCLSFALSASAADVTPQRLKNADSEPQNWLLPFGNYSSWSYSSLKQIDKTNVGNLHVSFMHAIGGSNPSAVGGANAAQRGRPSVNDGFMYVHNAWGQVVKIDVTSGNRGQTVWMNDPAIPAADTKMGSVALLGNAVYN